MLQRTLLVSLALTLCRPAMLHPDDAPKTKDKELDGKWESVRVVDDGEEVKEAFLTILIHGDKVTAAEGTKIAIAADGAEPREVEDSGTQSGTIKVDPKTWAIDFLWEDGDAKGKTVKGIYNVNKDVLLLCLAPLGRDRPTEFSTKKGSGCQLAEFKRVREQPQK